MNTNIRKDFPLLNNNKQKIVYFDNAATTLKPTSVINTEKNYYEKNSASVGRSVHDLGEKASTDFENTRKNLGKFFNTNTNEIIFTKNTTESINLLAYSLMNSDFFKKNDKIVLSEIEHHSNILPWQFVAKKTGAKLEFVKEKDFEIDLVDLEKKTRNAKLVSITGASNTIATKPNLKKIRKIVQDNNCLLHVDSAQLAPHTEINFKKIGTDFMSFSAHKMLGPTGVGCLIGKQDLLETMNPFLFGGNMIESVSLNESVFDGLPKKFEAGTPNIGGIIAFNSALNYIKQIGFDRIEKQCFVLKKNCLSQLKDLEKNGLRIYCNEKKNSAPIILFDFNKISCHDLAMLLNRKNIAVRSGFHCAEPIIKKYNVNGLVRSSFYFYNTIEEVNFFVKELELILRTIK